MMDWNAALEASTSSVGFFVDFRYRTAVKKKGNDTYLPNMDIYEPNTAVYMPNPV
ncbi:hypothetical protein [Salibacterium lacus]|uniref:Uncharacterized protein n=1 Tax=Salibacterium lacus TaxID=1898109 RepID=A0ABW5T309_9BACI